MKRVLVSALLLAGLVSACAIPGLGPNYAASDAYVRDVLATRNTRPTAQDCADAHILNANRGAMRQSDRDFIDGVLAQCNGN